MWQKELIRTKYFKIDLNMQVFGIGIGLKKHNGYSYWYGYYKYCCQILFFDIQIRLWKSKESRVSI